MKNIEAGFEPLSDKDLIDQAFAQRDEVRDTIIMQKQQQKAALIDGPEFPGRNEQIMAKINEINKLIDESYNDYLRMKAKERSIAEEFENYSAIDSAGK